MSTKFIAEAMNVSNRRIQQIIEKYRFTKIMPELTKSRRPRAELSDEQKRNIDLVFEEAKLSPRLIYSELKRRRTFVAKNKILYIVRMFNYHQCKSSRNL